ncbi:hypothetical protein [Vibrio coralliirubri]|uniref:hypothetical protein n=1 Tax=Vibrio coralliirubri TaxID=1516159 RepID=UPI0012FF8381|nr:hypothetical protein [Vibrio coralliirubri]
MEISRRDSLKMLGVAVTTTALPISFSSLSSEQQNSLVTNGYVSIDRASANQFDGFRVAGISESHPLSTRTDLDHSPMFALSEL